MVATLIQAAKYSLLVSSSSQTISFFVQSLIRTANVENETALHAAVRYNHKQVVELLVTEDPTDVHLENMHNETPLYLASIRSYTDILDTILEKCESPTFGGPEGRTALHAAVLDKGGLGMYLSTFIAISFPHFGC